ncbi:MAG: M36 family metallopeptidase [Pseudomonadota bacterium]
MKKKSIAGAASIAALTASIASISTIAGSPVSAQTLGALGPQGRTIELAVPAEDRQLISFDVAETFRADRAGVSGRVFGATPRDAITNRLAARLNAPGVADSLVETETAIDAGTGEISSRFEQRLDGLRVYGAYAKAVLSDAGELLFAADNLSSTVLLRGPEPDTSPSEALQAALAKHHPGVRAPKSADAEGAITTFGEDDFFFRAPSVERVYFQRGRALEQGYLVETWTDKDNTLYETLVDGDGVIVSSELRTNADRIRYYPTHPDASGSRTSNTPNRWTSGTQFQFGMQGPNAVAYLDRDANNSPDGLGSVISNETFTVSANLSQSPTTTQNRRAAIQNLFYWNNRIHDYLEARGFGDNDGNFEGADPVLAEAQDGGGFNNANFATPSSGSPRMQMFLWNLTNPNRDGDLDADIIWHEYGHGVTWRMVGNMSGSIAGALGEGNSDVLAILYTNNDRVGEYSVNRSNGIRSSRYSQHRDTLGDFNPSRGVHRNGEIYAAALWELRRLYRNAGIRNRNTIIGDVVRGYRFTPPQPTYIQMRNGLLQAAPASRDCFVWRAFARKGMGIGAQMTVSGGRITLRESFSVPNGC